MYNLLIKDKNIEIELSQKQEHEKIAMIPIKTDYSNNIDLITLKKGFELGLIEINECEPANVNLVIVKNNSVAPLILIGGEEVVGANQNRIVNNTTIIPPETTLNLPVSCVEKGRWSYKNEFKDSKFMATSNTRRAKAAYEFRDFDYQEKVWDVVEDLDCCYSVASPTRAMDETYVHQEKDINEYLNHFDIIDGQTGALILKED